MRIAQKKRYDESDVEALNKIASRAGRNKTFRLALTAFGIIDLGAAAASSYFHKQPWTFLICGIAMIALANVIVPMISRAGARKANSLLLDRFVKTVADDKGIKVESTLGDREFEWGFCEEAIDLADHVALRFGERSVVVFDKHGLKPE